MNARIHPPWTMGRVPAGFWDRRGNRVAHMAWRGRRLRFKTPDDWYAVTRNAFYRNRGGGLLQMKYADSPLAALRDFMPRRVWLPWLFHSTPQGFWQDAKNRRMYMAWFEKTVGIQRKEDWCRTSKKDFVSHHGAGLLANYYDDSVIKAVTEFKPRWRLQEWRFENVPQGFWKFQGNRTRYMDWLGDQLDIRNTEQWYDVSSDDIKRLHGATLLQGTLVRYIGWSANTFLTSTGNRGCFVRFPTVSGRAKRTDTRIFAAGRVAGISQTHRLV